MLYQHFSEIMRELSSHRQYLLALSGGLDSCVLLHLLKRFASEDSEVNVRAIHIHHGLSPHADQWAAFCLAQCQENGLSFHLEKVQINRNAKQGLEAEARSKRYETLARCLENQEVLLTAHHQSDQAETVLLQLFRGAGPKGLSAMPVKKLWASHEHLRPLLNFSREQLEEYAREHRLSWVEDESNFDLSLDRNFLRQSVFPVLKTRWLDVSAKLAKAAHSFSESAELMENLADLDMKSALTKYSNQLKIEPLLSLSLLRQKNVLRRFFQKNHALMPDRKRLLQIIETFFLSKADKNPCVRWKAIELQRFEGRLFLIPRRMAFDSSLVLPWDFKTPLKLPLDLGVLYAEEKIGPGLRADLEYQKISVRFRQGGEVMHWHRQTQLLKKLLQAWKIPPWDRGRIPLIFYEDILICVPGHAIADEYLAKNTESAYFFNIHEKIPCS